MRVIRHGAKGAERIGLLDSQGLMRDAHDLIGGDRQSLPAVLQQLGRLSPEDLPILPVNTRLGCPIPRIGKIVCAGLNYLDHASEGGMSVPSEPALFMKANTSIVGPNDEILIPEDATKVDWEVELGVVMGRTASRLPSSANPFNYIAGYTIVHDVSERAWQLEGSGGWFKGKSLDTFCPVGPWLVTTDEIKDPQSLDLRLSVNGETMQAASTRLMVFTVAFLVPYISRFLTLEPGDLISTGTPAGVGLGRKPPRFLRPDDVVELEIAQLGKQLQRVKSLDRPK